MISRAVNSPLRATAALTLVSFVAACGSSGGGSSATDPAATEPPVTEPPVTEPSTTETVELTQDTSPTAACPTEGEEWEVAKLYIEHNATDSDTGVHGLFGGMPWSVLCIWDPNGVEMIVADPLENFDRLAVSDFFFESNEPPNDEYPIDQLRADFPEGEYVVAGIDVEGTPRVGAATFTHDIPAEPNITFPLLADDPESIGDPIPTTGLVVTWDVVSETIDGTPVEITAYEVIITQEEWDDPNGLSRPVYDVHVPGDQVSLTVPDDFLRADTVYELEVLALEPSGNQTIGLGFFRTG